MNQEIPGWMPKRDLEILSYLSSCVPENGNILEVGSFLGRSTSALVASKKDSVSLDVVDTFKGIDPTYDFKDIEGNRDLFEKMRQVALETGDWEQSFRLCQEANIDKIQVNKCASEEFKIEKFYDFTFIDASHKFEDVCADISKFITTKGLLAGDDFIPKWMDVVMAVNSMRNRKFSTLVVPRGSKMWIMIPFANPYWKKCVSEIL